MLTPVCGTHPMTHTPSAVRRHIPNVDRSVVFLTHNTLENPLVHLLSRLKNKVLSLLASTLVLRRPIPSQRRTRATHNTRRETRRTRRSLASEMVSSSYPAASFHLTCHATVGSISRTRSRKYSLTSRSKVRSSCNVRHPVHQPP